MPQPNSGFSQKQWKTTKRRSPNKTERKGGRGGAWNFFRKKDKRRGTLFRNGRVLCVVYLHFSDVIFSFPHSQFFILRRCSCVGCSCVDAPFTSHFGFLLINRKLQKQFLFRTFSKMFLVQYNIVLFLVICCINGKRM